VAVVGAGIAGCCVARALARRGVGRVSVLDARGHPGDSLPAGLLGLLEPRMEKDGSLGATLHAAAAPVAIALYDQLAHEGCDPWRGPRGVISTDRGRRDDAWRRTVAAGTDLPEDWLALLDAESVDARVGVRPPSESALWHPRAGCLSPPALLPALLGDIPVSPMVVGAVEHNARGGWVLRGADGAPSLDADAVVLATASETARLWPAGRLPLRPTRGQVSVLTARGPDAPPRISVSGTAYCTPPVQDSSGAWRRVLGATQVPWRDGSGDPYTPCEDDHNRVRAALASGWPDLAAALDAEPNEGALAGLRATTPDHLPLAGPLFDADSLAESHGDVLRKDRFSQRKAQPVRWVDGLFTLCGMGSHGLAIAPLMAELIAAQITGTPWPLPPDLAVSVHPARFTVRSLIRARKGSS